MGDTSRHQRDPQPGDDDGMTMEKDLRRIAHMFSAHREEPLMRELCRLAIKCAQERLIRG